MGAQRGNTAQVFYKLVRDTGAEAPSVDRSGNIKKPKIVNETMWTTLRICGPTTARALAANASTEESPVSEETANTFLQTLNRAGYLDVVRPSRPGVQAVYRLKDCMNTGPKPPEIQRTKRVYDANLGREMYLERPELADEADTDMPDMEPSL